VKIAHFETITTSLPNPELGENSSNVTKLNDAAALPPSFLRLQPAASRLRRKSRTLSILSHRLQRY
jgi:hypothetical protein